MNDKVLVIMPVYNKQEFLENSIKSVLNQTHKNLILCIVDDHSTDSSLSIAKKYAKKDSRVSVLSNPINSGCYRTRNKGLHDNAKVDWNFFTIHDADDTSDPDRISYTLNLFKDSSIIGLKSTYERINQKGEIQMCELNPDKADVYSSEGIAFFRRFVFDNLGYYDDTRFSGDTDYWWRLEHFCTFNPQYRVASCLKPMYKALSHSSNLTKIYTFEKDRPEYFTKCHMDLEKMLQLRNFYRKPTLG